MIPILNQATVLITGGTGSFGQTMARYLLGIGVGELRILSRDEDKQHHLRNSLSDPRVKFLIGDVRNRESVDKATRGADFVFHAAALKQVPSCDFFPLEAVRTNVIGSANVVRSAIANHVKTVVGLSTDKAVFPVNTMGMTKAIMEKTFTAAARELGEADDTRICCVRYGNVMYSRGSVIPLFVEQIKAQAPLTITSENMTRFMMPLRDAVRLVEFAFQETRQGDLFIRKARACRIVDLAKALRELFDSEVPLEFIGIRHGEKLHETLATAAELNHAEDLEEYYRIPMDMRDLNYKEYFTEGEVVGPLGDFGSDSVDRMTIPEIKELLLSLDPVARELKGVVTSRQRSDR
jgi:UDP-glucose 4-epimerase